MTAWNNAHYARAREFLRLVTGAVAPAASDSAAQGSAVPVAEKPPLPPAAAAVPTAPEPAAAAPAARPTAAAVFKKIPWKK